MYFAAHDRDQSIAYWRVVGPITPSDWARHMADMEELARWRPEPRPAVLMEVVDFAPNARQRADLAERSGRPDYRPYLALVTRHAVLRGALRAIHWLQGSQSYEIDFFPDTATALRWLEARRDQTLAALRALELASRTQTSTASRP